METTKFSAYVLSDSAKQLAKGKRYAAQVMVERSTMFGTKMQLEVAVEEVGSAGTTGSFLRRGNALVSTVGRLVSTPYIRRKVIARTAHWVATLKDGEVLITSRKHKLPKDILSLTRYCDTLHVELDALFYVIKQNQITEPIKISAA